jgi:hypothetical protein
MTVDEAIDKRICWNVNPKKLDWGKNSRFIIERVLTRGGLSDVRYIFRAYTKIQLKDAVLNNKSLDKNR